MKMSLNQQTEHQHKVDVLNGDVQIGRGRHGRQLRTALFLEPLAHVNVLHATPQHHATSGGFRFAVVCAVVCAGGLFHDRSAQLFDAVLDVKDGGRQRVRPSFLVTLSVAEWVVDTPVRGGGVWEK